MSNQQLIDIIDGEFKRLEREGKGDFSTVQSKATFLKLDKAALSKLRSGARALSRRMAREIAEKLRPSDDPAGVQDLVEQLLATQPEPTSDLVEVTQWFSSLPQQTLLVVEFREQPALRPTGNRAHLTDAVADFIVGKEGFYAMLCPYNLADGAHVPTLLRTYLTELRQSVIRTYGAILDEVLDKAQENYRKNPAGNGTLQEYLMKVGGRIQLYELAAPDPTSLPATGYRLFYVKKHGEATAQRFEWFSSNDKDSIVDKKSSVADLEVAAVGFFPIVEFCDDHDRLPATRKEMIDFASDLERRDPYVADLLLGEPLWKPFREGWLQDHVEHLAGNRKTSESAHE